MKGVVLSDPDGIDNQAKPTVEGAVRYAADQLSHRRSPAAIVSELRAAGVSLQSANEIVDLSIQHLRDTTRGTTSGRNAKQRLLLRALLWLAVFCCGAGLSLAGYLSASQNPGGGSYIMFGGAMVIGAWNLVRSLVNYANYCREWK